MVLLRNRDFNEPRVLTVKPVAPELNLTGQSKHHCLIISMWNWKACKLCPGVCYIIKPDHWRANCINYISSSYINACVLCYRSAGDVVTLSAITYDRFGPQLQLYIIQYKSWDRGDCSVTSLSLTAEWGGCYCWTGWEDQRSHWVHYIKVRRQCIDKWTDKWGVADPVLQELQLGSLL